MSGLRRRYLASVSPGGGGAGEGREGTATRRLVVAMFNHALTEKWTIGNVPIIFTLHTLTSVCIFSTLFSIHFLWF